jgi:gliding motility-associated-like protein
LDDTSLRWQFSDDPSQKLTPAGPNGSTINHAYGAPGTYDVKLILVDTGYCNYPDTLKKQLRVSPLAKAQFVTPRVGCVPYLASFDNTSLGGLTFDWDFGDPGSGAANISHEVSPTHLYEQPGDYIVHLIVYDATTCNKQDETSFTLTVSPRPTAAYSFAPSPPVANTPMIFTNQSSGDAVRYLWDFGDGDTLMTTRADTIQHLYKFTDSFNVCLVAFNRNDCTDTVCHTVATLIDPLLDMPNAFTPGRFGQNSIFKVAGFGITKLMFKIYNRWGQLVFQSTNQDIGWDGTYQGTLQPVGVYVYTVEAEFSDGRKTTRKGDLTLLR